MLVLLSSVALALSGFICDFLWFREMGYVSVFLTEIVTKLKLGIPTFVLSMVVVLLLFKALKLSFLRKNSMLIPDKSKKRFRLLSAILAGVFAVFLTASVIPSLWFEILQFNNATGFNIKDPLFGLDLGFYMFKLDFLEGLGSILTGLVVLLLAVIALYYALLASTAKTDKPSEADTLHYEFPDSDESSRPKSGLEQLGERFMGGVDMSVAKKKGRALLSVASSQIMMLGILFFLSIAAICYLRRFGLLYGGTGSSYGAGYTDIKVTLTILNALMVLSLLSAVGIVIAFTKRKLLIALVCPAIMLIAVFVQAPVSAFVQNVIVAPDELSKESKYLAYNIEFTQQAYELDKISVKELTPDNKLTQIDVLRNMETFSNIRINDFEPAEQFYNQTQSIRSYYKFNDVDVDRYYVNGEYTQTFLSARELDKTRIEDSWLIRHIKYTHGYGITLSRVDKVTSSGQPDMLIDSIPPVSEIDEIQIARPEIYYGESTDEYVIVNTNEPEFDYPSGESNTYCNYEGEGGIRLTPLNRLLFAIRENSLKMLVSTNINSDSRIMIYRNISERVEKIAPFLVYDTDPYIVVVDGKLYWIINAYTTSANYPYSEPYRSGDYTNYVRNSVKVIVDAYNGDTDFYMVDEEDPVVLTLAKIYPELFKPVGELPEGFRDHLQYPNTLFNIQAAVYAKYHMSDVNVFYQNEDLWQISNEIYGQEEMPLSPNYFIMKLPGEDMAEFVSTLTYSPNGKSNLTAVITARNDGEHYGQIVLYKMPKDRIIYGPAQIEAQINQDADISKEFALWNNSGSIYSRGNIYVIPVENSLLYVEPIYLESATSSLPEVKRVVVFYGDKLAYEPTLAECLDVLFGKGTGDPLNAANPIEAGRLAADALEKPESAEPEPGEDPGEEGGESPAEAGSLDERSLQELAQLADEVYRKALSAMQGGDWTSYGRYMDELADLLARMAGRDAGLAPGDEEIVDNTEERN